MQKIITYLIVFLSILASGSLYFTSFNDDLFLITLLSLCFLLFLVKQKFIFNKYYFFYVIISIMFFTVHPLLSDNFLQVRTYVGFVVRILIFLFAISVIGKQNFAKIYVKIIFLYCICNLVVFFDHNILWGYTKFLANYLPQLESWAGNKFDNYLVYFEFSGDAFNPYLFKRNIGLFWEGGAYQYFLNLALIINTFFLKQKFFSFANFIFIFSILTTFSTTGYIILFFIVAAVLWKGKLSKKKITYAFILIPFILIGFNSRVIQNKLFNFDRAFNQSTLIRVADALTDIKVFQDNVILGIGLNNQKKWNEYSFFQIEGNTSSNGILTYVASVGIIGTIITLLPLAVFKPNKISINLIFICNLLSCLSQGFLFTPVFLLSMSLLNQKARIA